MTTTEGGGIRKFSANLPNEYIEGLDQLKKEWGLRSRGAVLERLLEQLFSDETEEEQPIDEDIINNTNKSDTSIVLENQYNEDKALVLIGKNELDSTSQPFNNDYQPLEVPIKEKQNTQTNTEIDLPGFVTSRTNNLRRSLSKNRTKSHTDESYIYTVKKNEVDGAQLAAKEHWLSLYGHQPGENVIEAAMVWLARDIWPRIEGSEDQLFTWSAALKLMTQYCPSWNNSSITLDTIIVIAGVLEDPFSSSNLKSRIPTLIRRFINQYKRRQNINSFQTIESTMTVQGALKLLGMPTQAGSALTLKSIKEAYKNKAMLNHPDAGGSTETMRKLNEGYQLLKNLYKNK